MSSGYQPLSTHAELEIEEPESAVKPQSYSILKYLLLLAAFFIVALSAYKAGQWSSSASNITLPDDSEKTPSESITPEQPASTDTPEMSQGKYSVG